MTRRTMFYQALGRWWTMAAMENYDWGQPDTPETRRAEDALWESKELYENGEIKLSDVRPVFDVWVKTHRKRETEDSQIVTAMRSARKQAARA